MNVVGGATIERRTRINRPDDWYFRERENTGLEILGFDDVKEIGYKANGEDYIPRRYCIARAFLNDEKNPHQVSYSISEDLAS